MDTARRRLSSVRGRDGSNSDAVTFPAREVERQISAAPKHPGVDSSPKIGAHVDTYLSSYLDPVTGKLVPFNEDRLGKYLGLAESLERVERRGMLGVPFVPADMRPEGLPLAEKLFAWKLPMISEGSENVISELDARPTQLYATSLVFDLP